MVPVVLLLELQPRTSVRSSLVPTDAKRVVCQAQALVKQSEEQLFRDSGLKMFACGRVFVRELRNPAMKESVWSYGSYI